MQVAFRSMCVDDPGCLQETIDNCCSDELHSMSSQIFRYLVGERGIGSCCVGFYERASVGEMPDVTVECSPLLLYLQECAGIDDAGIDLQTVADNACVIAQSFLIMCIEESDGLWVETFIGFSVILTLIEYDLPRQSGLTAFKDEQFEELVVIVKGTSPFLIVIFSRPLKMYLFTGIQ